MSRKKRNPKHSRRCQSRNLVIFDEALSIACGLAAAEDDALNRAGECRRLKDGISALKVFAGSVVSFSAGRAVFRRQLLELPQAAAP